MAYYDESEELSQREIEELIEDVFGFLPEEIADTLTEEQVEVALEKNGYDVKRTIASFKKKTTKTKIMDKQPPKMKTPIPITKSPLPKNKPTTHKTPSPLPSPSPHSMPTVQHSQKRHSEIINKVKEMHKTNQTPLTVIFCGHVDSGKSTTVGHILQELGGVTHSQIEKNKKECGEKGKKSFEYAWVMDTDDEERNRGITISVGAVEFQYNHKNIRILDAPGHTDFLMKTIDAMNEADVAVVVVDVDKHNLKCTYEGTFLDIVSTLAYSTVSKIIVAINKMDSVKWSESKYKSVVSVAEELLKEYNLDNINIRYIPISGLSGENLIKPTTSCKWCQESLLSVISEESAQFHDIEKPLRFICNDSYKQGNGSVITGIISSGVIGEKDDVIIYPTQTHGVIKKIKKGNQIIDCAGAGDIVEIQVDGTNLNIMKGYVIGSPAEPPIYYKKFHATVDLNCRDLIIRRGTLMSFYCSTGSSPCVFARIFFSGIQDVKVRPKKLKDIIQANVEIILQKPLCVDTRVNNDAFSHFFLRCNKITIGKGVITELRG
ncbi:elongation factor 1alpha, putative [Entamoeba histolytica KU27]|uniref:Elongation factor 1alpha, putative n=1 Tax=Entamoeba histolytica KU27 TaxID=885311 RepID=M2RJF2_ENTHI|nr:elongation factor 1alpha, putative [Entamoeba histolytica KU27]